MQTKLGDIIKTHQSGKNLTTLPTKLSPSFQNLQNFGTAAANIAMSPGNELIKPALTKLGVPPVLAGAAGVLGDFASPQAKVGQVMRVSKMADLVKARNLLTKATEKPGSVKFHMEQMKKGNYEPIKIRQVPEGLVIEDGRHRLEAARKLGLKELLTEDVSHFYQTKQGRTKIGQFDFKKNGR